MCEAKDVADYLLVAARQRGELLTNLKLQKLLYYAQAWFLVIHKKPLFEDDFQAWVHGPVLPAQYGRFKRFKWNPITLKDIEEPKLPAKVSKHLGAILDVFGTETAIALECMTHAEAPWRDARKGLAPNEASNEVIPKESMRVFYQAMADGHEQRQ